MEIKVYVPGKKRQAKKWRKTLTFFPPEVFIIDLG